MKNPEVPSIEAQVEQTFSEADLSNGNTPFIIKEIAPPGRAWPMWLLALVLIAAVVFVLSLVFLFAEWSTNSQSVLIDQLQQDLSGEQQESANLRKALAAAPTMAQLDELHNQHAEELEQLNLGWQGRFDELIERHKLDLQTERSRTEEARHLQAQAEADLANEVGGLPLAVSRAVNSTERLLLAEHFVGVVWQIERQWLGGFNDEDHIFQGDAISLFGVIQAPNAAYWNEDETVIRVPVAMPSLILSEFILDESALDPNYGMLADIGHLLGNETNTQPLLAEAKRLLRDKACNDIDSLRQFVNDTYKAALTAANGHQVQLRWQDKSGLYHDHQDVTDQMLLESACN